MMKTAYVEKYAKFSSVTEGYVETVIVFTSQKNPREWWEVRVKKMMRYNTPADEFLDEKFKASAIRFRRHKAGVITVGCSKEICQLLILKVWPTWVMPDGCTIQ